MVVDGDTRQTHVAFAGLNSGCGVGISKEERNRVSTEDTYLYDNRAWLISSLDRYDVGTGQL